MLRTLFIAVWLVVGGAAAVAQAPRVAPPSSEQKAEGCPRLVSSAPPRVIPAAIGQEDELGLTFVGHATFVIETPSGLRIATDFNDYVRPAQLPHVITMNRAHSTHYTDRPDAGIRHVLRGWGADGGAAEHDVTIADVRIRNVSTNIRGWGGGTDRGGNSIFVFESANLCVAHLGHLHHELTVEHLKQLGRIDVALVPVDGGYTLSKEQMIGVIKAMEPMIVIPMHFFSQSTLRGFLELAKPHFAIEYSDVASITLARSALPRRTKVLVLPGR